MKAKHEIAAIAVMIVICLLFAACAQKAEEKLTDKATDPALITSSTSESTETTVEVTHESTTASTTEGESERFTFTQEGALEELTAFYGTLYSVERSGGTDEAPEYIVKDNNGKEYAKVTVDLKTGYATEKVTGTGEVNKVNLLV